MIRRDDFVFTVGYQGDTAIVDARAKRQYRGQSAAELVANGLFKQAFCAALFDGDEEGMKMVLEEYGKSEGREYSNADELKRVFGVDGVRDDISRTKAL